MSEFDIWKKELINLMIDKNMNFGMIGDCITCIDEFCHRKGGIDLIYAWDNSLSYDEIINILNGMA